MSETTIVSLISLLGTLAGTFGGILVSNKLTTYRIEQLEKKVDKHNTVIERTYKLEQEDAVQNEELKNMKERMDKYENMG